MKNFDPKFKDFPDYILGITREIWEQRGVHTLHHYYDKDVIMRADILLQGNVTIINSTSAALALWPDRQLLGEDVIWSGSPEEGMLSSHRIFSTATGTDIDGDLCPIGYRVVADCHAKANVIDDEWLVRDQGAIARQLGYSPREYALKQINDQGGPEHCSTPFTPAIDVKGNYSHGRGNDDPWGQKYADILARIMSAEFSVIGEEYDRACHLEYPGGFTAHSFAEAEEFWLNLRSCIPNGQFSIDHQIGREDEMLSPRSAIRWSFQGKHEGAGMFGPASGADIYIMGICHAEFGPWGLRREYVLIDEVAVWKQILLATELAV